MIRKYLKSSPLERSRKACRCEHIRVLIVSYLCRNIWWKAKRLGLEKGEMKTIAEKFTTGKKPKGLQVRTYLLGC